MFAYNIVLRCARLLIKAEHLAVDNDSAPSVTILACKATARLPVCWGKSSVVQIYIELEAMKQADGPNDKTHNFAKGFQRRVPTREIRE